MRRPLLRLIGGTAVAGFLVVAFTPAVNLLSYWMAPPRREEPVEAIVVLGRGGVTAQGALTETSMRGAVDGILAYRKGVAPLVVFSGSPTDEGRDEAEARADLARECGLPSSAILTISTARTTREEALRMRALLEPRGIRRIMLVVDGPGMPRAVRVFEHLGFVVVTDPAASVLDLGGGPEDRLNLLRQLAMESAARVYYHLAGFL